MKGLLSLMTQGRTVDQKRMRLKRSALRKRYIKPIMVRVLPVPVAMASKAVRISCANVFSTAAMAFCW